MSTDQPVSSVPLPDEDDFTHYFKATQRLSAENADLRFRLKDVVSDNGRILCDIGRRDAEISKLRTALAASQQRAAELEKERVEMLGALERAQQGRNKLANTQTKWSYGLLVFGLLLILRVVWFKFTGN